MPTKEDLKKFLETFNRLSEFEGTHRSLRGWGVFHESTDTLPIPEVVAVCAWLTKLASED